MMFPCLVNPLQPFIMALSKRPMFSSKSLGSVQKHIPAAVLGPVLTFLQNLVNDELHVADLCVFLEVSVPFCRIW